MRLRHLAAGLFLTASLFAAGCCHSKCRPGTRASARLYCPPPCAAPCCPPAGSYAPPALAVPAAPVPITAGFNGAYSPGCCR